MTAVTITGDSHEAVAFALTMELRGVPGGNPENLTVEGTLALYRRCLATVRGIDPSKAEGKPAGIGRMGIGLDGEERI